MLMLKLKTLFKNYLIFAAVVCFSFSSFGIAEDVSQPSAGNVGVSANTYSDCSITIRSIKGVEHSDDRSDAIDGRFSDIKDQLENLPFAHFEPIDAVSDKTNFEQEAHLNLRCAMGNLHKLSITPHGLSDEKIDTTISWTAPNGEIMVASRMKFPNGQSMVLGTEHPKETCTIMVIKVDCVR